MSWDEAAFIEKLEGSHTFPGSYTFKFIVKPEHQSKVEALVPAAKITYKPSSGNKYMSITIVADMESSVAVVAVYKEAKKIDGIIAL